MNEVIVNENEKKKVNYYEKYYLLISIAFLIFGSILATNPLNIVKVISYIVGGTLLVIGACRIISFIIMKKKYQTSKISSIISGIILCILGIIACIWGSTVETVIRIIFGAWILYTGITQLISALSCQKKINPNTIVAIIIMVIGLLTILIKYIEFRVLGVMIIMYAIADVVGYIFMKKSKKDFN